MVNIKKILKDVLKAHTLTMMLYVGLLVQYKFLNDHLNNAFFCSSQLRRCILGKQCYPYMLTYDQIIAKIEQTRHKRWMYF